ncbi:uncharacterized protein C10orf95 homolog [Erinaceus europaeus]|uniref:Uncharacterized protein C10orf95 homolog n=1 Tax=Erinaceus europaeus TaxID=9365 RepID=A0ABM3VRI9_ERIEU|nr:uncharacterized protein C10orf95 homolog [Erinaceus europaeus]
MYSFGCLGSSQGVWPRLQPLTYTYLPGPVLLPPIQSHNFCSRPLGLGVGPPPREYHCFHGPAPWWPFPPQIYAAALQAPLSAPGYQVPSLQAAESSAWPEGASLQAELRWGRVERALGPRLQLPDFVHRELRRVYGTYPRTDVRVTYSGGEFLVQASPRVPEPEYRVETRVLRAPASGDGRDSSPAREAAERGRRKRRGLS